MAHELETHNGQTAFFSARQDAWHRLGTVTTGCLTADQVMTTAHLGGWNVRPLELTATEITEDGVTTHQVTDQVASARTNPFTGKTEILGIVGRDSYEFVQNEQTCELLNLLVDEGGAHFETAGSLRGGRSTFVTMKLPRSMALAGHDGPDDMDLYLAALGSHDGTEAWRTLVTPVRIVCANTERIALRDAKATYSIRHTRSARGKIAEVRTALGLVWRYCDSFEKAAQQLINESLTLDEFQAITAKVWPIDPTAGKRADTNRGRRNTSLNRLFTTADTQANIVGTKWAGLQAVTEYLDHEVPAKTDEVRATRVLCSSDHAAKKQLTYELLTV
ncbi:MAG: DUF932 domain-containing protein [Pseudonocardiaceae bacterium]